LVRCVDTIKEFLIAIGARSDEVEKTTFDCEFALLQVMVRANNRDLGKLFDVDNSEYSRRENITPQGVCYRKRVEMKYAQALAMKVKAMD
jgi:hypothetical protein